MVSFKLVDSPAAASSMPLAAIVLALISLVIAATALGWNIAQFLLGGARPRAHLITGAITAAGLVTWPLNNSSVEQVDALASQGLHPQRIIGVKVVNHGRAPARVQRWSVTGIGGGIILSPPVANGVGPSLPHDLAAGANAVWVVDIHAVAAAAAASNEVLNQQTELVRVTAELDTGKTLSSKEAMSFKKGVDWQ